MIRWCGSWGPFAFWKLGSNLMVSLDGVGTITDYVVLNGHITEDTWQHIAVTYDGRYICGYYNGVRKKRVRENDTPVNIATSNYPLRIGWYNSGTPHFRGMLDNVRLFNHAISATEVIADMTDDQPVAPSPLKAVWASAAATAIIKPDGLLDDTVTAAAEELQYHIQQATGVTLGIYTESSTPAGFAGYIYVGPCAATKQAGIEGDYLEQNTWVARSVGANLFLAGKDSYGDPFGALHTNYTNVGTLLAVYRFLENAMGVQWLWPGQSGEVIPTTTDLVFSDIDLFDEPVLKHTRLRDYGDWGTYGNDSDHLGWVDPNVRDIFLEQQSRWMRRQGFALRSDVALEYGHSFITWWDQYGATHPEYFNLLPDGTRRSDPTFWNGASSLIDMDVTDPCFIERVVDNWIAAGNFNKWINCSMNDTNSKCVCPECLARDVEPPNFEADYGYPWSERLAQATAEYNNGTRGWEAKLGPMSDRYARFLLDIQACAASKGYGDQTIVGYAYSNRKNAPMATWLGDQFIIGIVPGLGYPFTDETQTYVQSLWMAGRWVPVCGRICGPTICLMDIIIPRLWLIGLARILSSACDAIWRPRTSIA